MLQRSYLALLFGCLVSQSVFATSCEQGELGHIWISPQRLKAGESFKVLAVSSTQPLTELILTLPKGEKQRLNAHANSGSPWSLTAQVNNTAANYYQIEAKNKDKTIACRVVLLGENADDKPSWNAHYEAFYAAWIEQLFDAPVSENLSFPALEPVLRNAEHNFLYNYWRDNEDKALPATPDCADLPYFLRNYFAWKNRLPMSFRACSRGAAKSAPTCDSATIRTDYVEKPTPLAQFKALSHQLMDVVHSGNTRTASYNEDSDFYPLALRRDTLVPGTIYADPYGHVLMIVKWVAQTSTSQGLLLAVDAQPDNSITRKRFWEGTFLFTNSVSAVPGFKAFRPIANSRSLFSNAELPGFSAEQENIPPEEFYARMEKLINPHGLDAKQAYEARLNALLEQVEARVQSVENGERYFRNGGRLIAMPKGAAIFETVGAWEDYATPSRDMRLLIAIDVLLNFPEKIMRYPALFNLTAQTAAAMKAQIMQLHEKLTAQKRIHYVGSDGKSRELTLAAILARKAAFEMSYNPNDCVELRWGAKEGSEEYAGCTRHAPLAQLKQMLAMREWFRDMKRPPR